jgi:hypothetical protein
MRPNIRRRSGYSCVASLRCFPYTEPPQGVCVYLASLLRTRKQMALWGLRTCQTVGEDGEASEAHGIALLKRSVRRALPTLLEPLSAKGHT